jgi:hypothetical protein
MKERVVMNDWNKSNWFEQWLKLARNETKEGARA